MQNSSTSSNYNYASGSLWRRQVNVNFGFLWVCLQVHAIVNAALDHFCQSLSTFGMLNTSADPVCFSTGEYPNITSNILCCVLLVYLEQSPVLCQRVALCLPSQVHGAGCTCTSTGHDAPRPPWRGRTTSTRCGAGLVPRGPAVGLLPLLP